jgi:hypothetical protein
MQFGRWERGEFIIAVDIVLHVSAQRRAAQQ